MNSSASKYPRLLAFKKKLEWPMLFLSFVWFCILIIEIVNDTSPVKWTPSFRPLSAENKMDSRGLLSWLLLFVCCSLCALKPFGKERTSRAGHYPSSLSRLLGFLYLPPQVV
jgi:hypothetical protein